jgi:hypothetical protein
VGGAPQEPLRLAMGWSEMLAYDHVRRLVGAGLVRRVPMTRGDGSLIIATPAGATIAGYQASRAPRSAGRPTWAQTCARAWVCAWLDLRMQTRWAQTDTAWWSPGDVADDECWHCEVHYKDRRHGKVSFMHRPDAAVRIAEQLIPIEIEHDRSKTRRRLLGILEMYAELCSGDDAPFWGVIYITGHDDVDDELRGLAEDAGLEDRALSVRRFEDIVEQTYSAARDLATNCRPADREATR